MNKSRSLIAILAIFSLFAIDSESYSGTIDCSYRTDHANNQKNMGEFTEGYVGSGGSGSLKTDIFALAAGALFNSIDEDKFYCVYQEEKTDIQKSTKHFYNMLETRELIPVYLYEGLSSKFYEEEVFKDINTPYSDKRDETAGRYAFVFSESSVKSKIKYFGFYSPADGRYILWYVNKKAGQMGALEEDQYPRALEYTKKRDTTRSVQDLHAIAKFGEFDAINSLCHKYYNGKDVKKDFNAAVQYCVQAGNKGGASAQNLMGYMCEHGLGAQKNEKDAFDWYTLASKQDFAQAHVNLIDFYLDGKVVEKNYDTAFNLAVKAANKKNAIGQTWLAVFYEKGIGTSINYPKAIEYYKLAAENNHAFAQYKLGEIYEQGKYNAPTDYKEAEKWYSKAARNGNKDAEKALAKFKK